MWFMPRQLFKSVKDCVVNLSCPKFLNELVVIYAVFIGSNNFPWVDDLLALREGRMDAALNDLFGAVSHLQRHL